MIGVEDCERKSQKSNQLLHSSNSAYSSHFQNPEPWEFLQLLKGGWKIVTVFVGKRPRTLGCRHCLLSFDDELLRGRFDGTGRIRLTGTVRELISSSSLRLSLSCEDARGLVEMQRPKASAPTDDRGRTNISRVTVMLSTAVDSLNFCWRWADWALGLLWWSWLWFMVYL